MTTLLLVKFKSDLVEVTTMKYYHIEFNFLGDIVLHASSKEKAMEKFFALTVGALNEIADEKLTLIEEDDE